MPSGSPVSRPPVPTSRTRQRSPAPAIRKAGVPVRRQWACRRSTASRTPPPASPGAGNAEPGRPSLHAPRAVRHGPATSASAATGNAAWVMLARAVKAPTAKGGPALGNANAGCSAAHGSGTLLANRRQRRGREVKTGSSTWIANAGWHPCRQHGCPDANRIAETKGWAPDRAQEETASFRRRNIAAVPRNRRRRPSSA